MRYRPVDDDGDMMPIHSESQMLQGSSAVAAAVNSRLRLLCGEWWQDESLGFRLPSFLFQGTRLAKNIDILIAYIGSYVSKTEGVTSASCTAEHDDRTLRCHVDVTTEYSQATNSVEVNENVIRSAIS